jgi:hypothetical protein
MQRFFLISLFVFFTFSQTLQAQTTNQNDLLKVILDLPAPAPNESGSIAVDKKPRPPEFFDDKNVPPDDAPIEDLLDFWAKQNEGYSRLNYHIKPSEKTAQRILEACLDDPPKLINYLSILPADAQSAEIIKSLYDNQLEDKKIEPYLHSRLKQWLKGNSTYFVDELVREARKIKDENDYVQNNFQDALLSLAKVDWDSARPIAENLENNTAQPYSAILAKWVQYKRAMETEDSSTAEKYRRMLQEIVENKNAAWAMRDLAMDALASSGDWQGRDEWYISLLEDETLLTIQDNGNTGLTTLIAMSPPQKWTEKMLELLKSSNFAVRSAAARNLMESFDGKDKKVIEGLLPWLSDPNWAKQSRQAERKDLIAALATIHIPESVPSLIAIVMNEGEFRSQAVSALISYKDTRAVPALKFALSKEKAAAARSLITEALIASGGLSDDEQMTALEAYAAMASTPEGQEQINFYQFDYYEGEEGEEIGAEEPDTKPLPLIISIGKTVSEQEEPSDGLVVRAAERIKILRQTKPAIADTLLAIMQKWKGRAIYSEILSQIKSGEADVETILSILEKRKDVREKVLNELAVLRASTGTARGIGACILEEESEFLSILGQTDAPAQTAMLGCSRLIRAKLPVTEVGAFLKNPNKILALAAERYLESEDSVQARMMVLAAHPNEAVILGARQAFVPDEKANYDIQALNALFESVNGTRFWSMPFSGIKKNEERLRNEIKTNPEITAIYAIFQDDDKGQQIIRVYKDKVVYTFEEDTARYWEKTLTAKEYEDFYRFLLENKIDSLSPLSGACEHCQSREFVMFGLNGGRRVFVRSETDENHAIDGLFKYFDSFKQQNLKLNYRLSDKLKGLEVLLADKNFNAVTVWKKDADLRVLIEDKLKQQEIEKDLREFQQSFYSMETENEEDQSQRQARYASFLKKRAETALAHYGWYNIQNDKLGGAAAQPPEVPFLNNQTFFSPTLSINTLTPGWKVRAGNSEIRAGELYEGGLYKISGSSNPFKFKEGLYANPITTADGKWAVAIKAETDWSEPKTVVRINLATGREFKISVPPSDVFYPVAFIGSHNKFLLYRGRGNFLLLRNNSIESIEEDEEMQAEAVNSKKKPNPSPKTPEYYLFDANTGASQLVKGEFLPLLQQTFRPLQPTAVQGEFWAAIFDAKTNSTSVGRYNDKTFAFQSLAKIPDINLNSMDIWVDEKESKIYFVYQGHLLALPFAKQ